MKKSVKGTPLRQILTNDSPISRNCFGAGTGFLKYLSPNLISDVRGLNKQKYSETLYLLFRSARSPVKPKNNK